MKVYIYKSSGKVNTKKFINEIKITDKYAQKAGRKVVISKIDLTSHNVYFATLIYGI